MLSRASHPLAVPAVLLGCLAGALLLGTAPAEAKPKRIVSNGCTAEQIQSSQASQCLDQLEDDVIHRRPTVHALYCSSSGKLLCCEYDAETGAEVPHSCGVIASRANPLVFTPTFESLTGANSDGPIPPTGGGGGAGGRGGKVDPGGNASLGNAGVVDGGGPGIIP